MPTPLMTLLEQAQEFVALREGVRAGKGGQMVYGLTGSLRSLLAGALAEASGRPLLLITTNQSQAEALQRDLQTWLPEAEVLLFAGLEYLPFSIVAHSPELMAQRLGVLERVVKGGRPPVVVTPVAALLRQLTPASVFRSACLTLSPGQVIDEAAFLAQLVRHGYERTEMVEGPGQFSRRGGIIDIYPLTAEWPVRLELWGDEIDSLRRFDPATQRSTGEGLTEVFIGPAREFILPADTAAAVAAIRDDLEATVAKLQTQQGETGTTVIEGVDPELASLFDPVDVATKLRERVEEHLERLAEGQYFEGLDRYASYFYQEPATLFDYFAEPPLVVVDEPARVREAIQEAEARDRERQAALLEKGGLLPGQLTLYLGAERVFAELKDQTTVHLAMLPKTVAGLRPSYLASLGARPMQEFHGQWPLLLQELRRWQEQRQRVLLLAATAERQARLREALIEAGLDVVTQPAGALQAPVPGSIAVGLGMLHAGFQWPALRLTVVADGELFGRPKRRRLVTKVAPQKEGVRIASYHDLKAGDYVVHAAHGIGRYLGLETMEVAGVQRDYLTIKYDGTDRLFIPTEQVHLIQKYISAEGHEPKLSKLGGAEWKNVKARVRESVREMAAELLRLQAVREALPGTAYPPDTPWQREFEDAFPFEETPDQLKAIAEIKADLERGRPMDRLLLGDVGYGKTEVALRAAFKVASEGKQVAFLVPTTILAQQHYATCQQRFGDFPIRVGVLNRYKSAKEQNEVIAAVARGEIDVVVGTHRLLSEDVRFKDLGLVIVDEEQRFGVQHKEKLKQLRQTVDVLTLSATPIPRTLHMAMVGLRDMSVISTPPEDRYPVETYVAEWDDDLVRDAINRELYRGGQVYVVHNRVQSIDRMAAHLNRLVPEARIAVAHGQMKEDRLERVMLDFLAGEYDVLLATTIIESGVDIPSVNTIIVDQADYLGLSQLYQLRGRVGRSNRLAYAYFLYRRDKVLTEVAEKRLAAIKDFTELGAGFKIALRDLEIRGAGNILGPEQSGQIVSVGFDLYCQMLEEAVAELKGQKPVSEEWRPTVELSIDAYIPDGYISEARQKIDAYRRIAAIREAADRDDVQEELEDRYGPLPEPVQNLLALAWLRVLAARAGFASITEQRRRVQLKFLQPQAVKAEVILALNRKLKGRLSGGGWRVVALQFRSEGLRPAEILAALEEIVSQFLGQEVLSGSHARY